MKSTTVFALPLAAAVLASARMQHVRRSPLDDAHCRLAARAAAAAAGSTDSSGAGAENKTVAAAWFEGWNANFTADDVSWDKYTHVTYSFAVTQPDGTLDLTGSGGDAGLKTFVAAAKNATVKALVSVGGWTGSTYWSSYVASAENRTAFVTALGTLVKTYELDGLDFDWEYPVTGGTACNVYSTTDTANYLLFLKELRTAQPDLLLTAAAGISPWKDASGTPSTDVSEFAKVLDWVAIMNYDEYGQWSTTAGPNAALNDTCVKETTQAQGSAVSAVAAWTAAGIPASQLVLGVASYGHAFSVSQASAYGTGTGTGTSSSAAPSATLGARADDDDECEEEGAGDDDGDDDDCGDEDAGELTLFPSYSKWTYAPGEAQATECGQPAAKDVQYTFAELVTAGFLSKNGTAAEGVAYVFDECSQTPFVYHDGAYVSYDDARSFAAKGAFIKDKGLRGFAMWEASGDHEDMLLDAILKEVN